MTAIIPTRMELRNLNLRLKSAQKGYDLLKKKSDALAMKFRSILREIRDSKIRVGNLADEAFIEVSKSNFTSGKTTASATQLVSDTPKKLMMTIDNVAGVRVPHFIPVGASTSSDNLLGLSKGGEQLKVIREKFNSLMQELIHLAELQASFNIIDDILKVTNRRVNAMEYVLIPRYKSHISFVEFTLDENDKEEFYRLKKVQSYRKEVAARDEAMRLLLKNSDGEQHDASEKKKSSALYQGSDDDLIF